MTSHQLSTITSGSTGFKWYSGINGIRDQLMHVFDCLMRLIKYAYSYPRPRRLVFQTVSPVRTS